MAEKNDVAETVRKGILVELTANIVSAYLGKNSVPGVEIPGLIRLETFRGGEGVPLNLSSVSRMD